MITSDVTLISSYMPNVAIYCDWVAEIMTFSKIIAHHFEICTSFLIIDLIIFGDNDVALQCNITVTKKYFINH